MLKMDAAIAVGKGGSVRLRLIWLSLREMQPGKVGLSCFTLLNLGHDICDHGGINGMTGEQDT